MEDFVREEPNSNMTMGFTNNPLQEDEDDKGTKASEPRESVAKY